MPYTRLPLETFKAKYPAFPELAEPTYAAWAVDAESEVSERYGDHQQRATELLTAHLLASNGAGLSAAQATLTATGATSFKSGTFSASISESVVAKRVKGGLGATLWGEQFAAIRRGLFGGPMLVGYIGVPC